MEREDADFDWKSGKGFFEELCRSVRKRISGSGKFMQRLSGSSELLSKFCVRGTGRLVCGME